MIYNRNIVNFRPSRCQVVVVREFWHETLVLLLLGQAAPPLDPGEVHEDVEHDEELDQGHGGGHQELEAQEDAHGVDVEEVVEGGGEGGQGLQGAAASKCLFLFILFSYLIFFVTINQHKQCRAGLLGFAVLT